MNWQHPRDEILATMERIYRSRMTTTSGGNLSIREENGDVWITPARVDKGSLRRDDIILVRADGSTDGKHRPSSELPFHQGGSTPLGRMCERSFTRIRSRWSPSAFAAECPTRDCCISRGVSAAKSVSLRMPCPAAQRWERTSPRLSLADSIASCWRIMAS